MGGLRGPPCLPASPGRRSSDSKNRAAKPVASYIVTCKPPLLFVTFISVLHETSQAATLGMPIWRNLMEHVMATGEKLPVTKSFECNVEEVDAVLAALSAARTVAARNGKAAKSQAIAKSFAEYEAFLGRLELKFRS